MEDDGAKVERGKGQRGEIPAIKGGRDKSGYRGQLDKSDPKAKV
jgi:hypothetical protein